MGLAMTLLPYHAGLLVPDLRAAMGALAAELGYTFVEPVVMRSPDVEDRVSGIVGPMEIPVTYSREGPLHVELIEFVGTGVFGPERGQGLHHLGVWAPDLDARLAELEAAGASIDAVFRAPDGSVSAFYARSAAGDTRTEYVSERQRDRLESWFRTGVLAPRGREWTMEEEHERT